jgi:hypothetical protein
MRLLILIAAIAVPFLFTTTEGNAAEIYPWCVKASEGRDYSVDLCYYRTYAQCARERFNYGSTSICTVNPEYYFKYGEPGESPRKPKRKDG